MTAKRYNESQMSRMTAKRYTESQKGSRTGKRVDRKPKGQHSSQSGKRLWAMLTRAGHKIVISLLVIVILYLLTLLVIEGHVLESTSNEGTITDMVFYI